MFRRRGGACRRPCPGCRLFILRRNKLVGDTDGVVSSQGGFLVEKGDYIYFVNGDESNTATNKYGKPVKGSIMRISHEDLAACNYGAAETVVPLIAYSGNNDAGIFIYGDRVYYATPSTEKNSDGEVLNDKLDFKSTRLDGTKTMKNYYVQTETNTTEYRYVEVDGTVYLMYVAEDETYFDETTGVINLHSYNTETGENTILAYNISSYIFDSSDVTNPRVYYTMTVKNYAANSTYSYNQLYTVTADATEDDNWFADIDTDTIPGWTTEEDVEDDDDDDNDNDYDRYINCGQLVYDGIGNLDISNKNGYNGGYTVFNYGYDKASKDTIDPETSFDYCNTIRYTFGLAKYTNGYLFYQRSTTNLSDYLFDLRESDFLATASDGSTSVSTSWTPLDTRESGTKRLADGSSAATYFYLFDDDGNFNGIMQAESGGGVTVNYLGTEKEGEDGELRAEVDLDGVIQTEDRANEDSLYYYIDREAVATLLFTEDNYIYYSTTGTNGITIHRVDYTGTWADYNGMPEDEDYTDEYIPTQIYDIDAVSGWYNPEIVDNQMIFAADFDDMSEFNYLMVADLRDANGNMMTNAAIAEINDKIDDIADAIADYSDTDDYPTADYANLTDAIWFAYYSRDDEYIYDLAVLCNEDVWEDDEDADPVYSDKTLALYQDFIEAKGDWADYAAEYKTINGETIYSNSRDYYYTLFGKMSDDDADDWLDELKDSYLQAEPDQTWFESLSLGGKVGFIIGMCLCGLVVIAGITILTVFLVKRSKRKRARRTAGDIVVATDVNREEDVYSQDNAIPADTVMDMNGNVISDDSGSGDDEPTEVLPDDDEPTDSED